MEFEFLVSCYKLRRNLYFFDYGKIECPFTMNPGLKNVSICSQQMSKRSQIETKLRNFVRDMFETKLRSF